MSAPELTRLPCGCRMGRVNDIFVMEPCSPDCGYARYAAAESKRQGNKMRAMDSRHMGSIPTFTEIACPHCGEMNDAHTRDTGDQPQPGNIGLCWTCHGFSVYDLTPFGQLTQRVPTAEEQQEIEADPGLQDVLTALRESSTPLEASDFLRKLGRP